MEREKNPKYGKRNDNNNKKKLFKNLTPFDLLEYKKIKFTNNPKIQT